MEYLESINELWQALTGRDLTPLEWAFGEALELAGVPLAAAREGISRAFRHFRPSPGRAKVRSFMYCVGSIVDTAVEMYPETHWEARRSTPPPPNGEREKGLRECVTPTPKPQDMADVLGAE